MTDNSEYEKYLKYKVKYFNLKKELAGAELIQIGGSNLNKTQEPKIDTVETIKNTNIKEKEEKDNNTKDTKIIIMLFKAEWCGHCKSFKETWGKLEENYNKKFNFITYDADTDKKKMNEYNVEAFPTIMFKMNNKLQQYNGDRNYNDIAEILDNF